MLVTKHVSMRFNLNFLKTKFSWNFISGANKAQSCLIRKKFPSFPLYYLIKTFANKCIEDCWADMKSNQNIHSYFDTYRIIFICFCDTKQHCLWYLINNSHISLFLASNFLRMSYDSAKACAVVETGPSSTGGISSSNLNDLNNAHSSSISDTQFSGDHQLQTFDTNGNYGLDQDSFRCKFNELIINLDSIS